MVYLIHLDREFKGCRHYIGWAKNECTFERRMEHHRKGSGAHFMKAVTEAGIEWKVVRTWPDEDGNFERKLKNQKNDRKN